MLLPIFCCLADVIAICYFCGRCKKTCFVSCLIELTCGQMLLPFIFCIFLSDWCYCHCCYWSLWLMLLSHWCYCIVWQMLCHVVWYHLHLLQEGIFLFYSWLMLLPLCLLGWCYCHMYNLVGWCYCQWLMLLPHNCSSCLADVVAMVVDVKSTHGCIGRCYSQGGLME